MMDEFEQIMDNKITEIRVARAIHTIEEKMLEATNKLSQLKTDKNLKAKECKVKELEELFYSLAMNANLLKNFLAYNMDPEDVLDYEDREEI